MSSGNPQSAPKSKVLDFEAKSQQDLAYRKGLAARIRLLKASNPAESPSKNEDLKRLMNFVLDHKEIFLRPA